MSVAWKRISRHNLLTLFSLKRLIVVLAIFAAYLYLFYTPEERLYFRLMTKIYIRRFIYSSVPTYQKVKGEDFFGIPGLPSYTEGPLCKEEIIRFNLIHQTKYQPGYNVTTCP